MYDFKIGTDPEFGILNIETNFAYPPIALIEFDNINAEFNKKNPEHWIFNKLRKPPTVLHMDGAALELEIKPERTASALSTNIMRGLDLINNTLNYVDGKIISYLPTLNWDVNEYTEEKYGEAFVYANRFGCDPDFDAFDSNEEQLEEDAEFHPYRYFGGHIHLGVPDNLLQKTKEIPHVLTKLCAIYWGNLCTFKSNFPEQEKLRLYRYGKPGRYRPQLHGIEYRSPSNSWLISRYTIEEIFNSTQPILTAFDNEKFGMKVLNLAEDTRKAIENFDIQACEEIYNDANKMYKKL